MSNDCSRPIHPFRWARRGALAATLGGAFFLAACGGGGSNDDGIDDDDPLVHGWTTAALFESASGPAARPEVVVDLDDNATVVWTQFDGGSDQVYARRYSPDGGLGEVVALSDVGLGVMGPKIGVDGAGKVFAVWSEVVTWSPLSMSIQSSIYSPATDSWSDPVALVTKDGNVVDPRIAVDASGTATVIWRERDAVNDVDVYACRFTASTPCTPVQLAHLVANGDFGALEVAAGPGNRAMAVWTAFPQGATAHSAWAGTFNGSGWSTKRIDAGGDSGSPRAAFDGAGNAMVVWAEKNGDEAAATPYHIRSWGFLADTGWEAAPLTLDETATGNAEDPRVAFDSSGDAVVVWNVATADGGRIRFGRRNAGSAWGDLAYLDDGTGENYGAALTIDGSDNITVAWQSTDYVTYTLAANRYEPATGWGEATTISAADQGDAGDVSVASDSQGRAIAVWEQENVDASNTNGWFSVYQ